MRPGSALFGLAVLYVRFNFTPQIATHFYRLAKYSSKSNKPIEEIQASLLLSANVAFSTS